MITYMHEAYIGKAIESVLGQKTNFQVELVVGEDASSDNTRGIIEDYVRRYPKRIRLIPKGPNVGPQQNFTRTFLACKGKYIAMLEGDDCWTVPHKLQKQVDFLENNPDYAVSAHNLSVINAAGKAINDLIRPEKIPTTYTLENLAIANVLLTASCIYRNTFTAGPNPTGLPDWFVHTKIGDYCLHMLAARHGKVMYFPDVMGAYRIHDGGIWTRQDDSGRVIMYFEAIYYLRKEFKGEVKQKLLKQLLDCLQMLSRMDAIRLDSFLLEYKTQMLDLIMEDYSLVMKQLLHSPQHLSTARYSWIKQIRYSGQRIINWYKHH
ncbi:hypothetical protein GCM10028824_17360 [Hymenobacter segetis]|uniref:Glycosyltransferase n=2 Tax=Hymenobacter segetis TaxID=2025509 RepID=A0ABU9LY04_9BACT